jgi:hypothetical protein
MSWMPKGWILIGVLLAVMAATAVAQVTTTQVADTIYHADGTVATGTVLISWPAFTTSTGESIASGSTSAVIAAGGALSVNLTPNTGSTPMGSYYTAVFHLDDGSVSREYWVVPVSSTSVKISAIESTLLPTSVAMQTVSKSYVDTAIAAAQLGGPLDSSPYVLKAGDTMTGPLVLPADPVSANQAADKSYVDENIAAVSSGLGQKVSTLPTATQIVAQPAGTELDVNDLSDVEYASQYLSGLGGNGIANIVNGPACTGGCDVKVEQDYTTEKYVTAALNSQTHIKDARGGRQTDSYLNPLDVVNSGISIAQTVDDVSTQSEASLFQQTGNADPAAVGLAITQKALAGGSNQFPQDIESSPYFKMGYSALAVNATYNTQGQHGLVPEEVDCFGVGDCLLGSQVILASGGFRDGSDEGAHPYDIQVHEDSRVFDGTCLTGCTTGSTSVMLTPIAGGGTQGDGRFLIDTNPAKTISSASTGGQIIGGSLGVQQVTAQFSGTSFPLSVFLTNTAVIPSQANDIAPGTVTFAIATSGVPAGYATNTAAIGSSSGVACVADQKTSVATGYEMAAYSVVDATHLQMTLNKPHHALATLSFGGLCGYGLEQTVDTVAGIRQVFPVVGSYSATGLYYSAGSTAVIGATNETDGFVNMSVTLASLTRAGGVVSVTATGALSSDVNGLTVTVAGVADSSFNGNYVITTTGSNTFTYTQSGPNSSSTGGLASVITGGFVLYPMAEVLSVFDAATRGVDGQMTLAPNNVPWAINDAVEEPHYYQEYVTPDIEFVGQTMPRPTQFVRAGIQYEQNNTAGVIGWSINNASPPTNYLGYGGTHTMPEQAYEALGVWRRTMSLPAGEQAVFAIHCNYHGCGNWNSGYDLFELDNPAGFDTVHYTPSTHGMLFNLGSASYNFTPLGFTAGTINVSSLNATTINGALRGAVDAAVIGGVTPGPVTATQLNGLPVGEYTNAPRKPLVTWMQALHNSANQPARVLLPGDSFGICGIYNCTDGVVNQSNLWSEQLRINLQAQYGSHGTGVVPVVVAITSPELLNNAAWSVTGTTAIVDTLGPSIPGATGGTLMHLSSGATITFNDSREIPFDHFSVYYATPTSSSSLALVADGSTSIGTATSGSATATGAAAGGLTSHRFDSSSLALATHTITGACTGDCYVWAADGTAGTTGVSIDNVSVGACPAECFGLAPATQFAFTDLIPGSDQGVIVMQQTNEPGQGYSTSSFSTAMNAIVAHEQGLSTIAPASVMLAVPPVGSIASSTMASFTAVQIALSQTLNVAFVNLQDRWGTAYVSTSGLWDFSASCVGCHPNDKGSRDEYSQIWASFVDPVPFDGKSGGTSITLTTIGTNGPATLIGGVLNIPNYTVACPSNFCLSLNPASLTYVPGLAATQTIPIAVTQFGATGYSSTVTYSTTGIPAGMTTTASPSTITGGSGTTTVTASFPWNQASGSNAFTVSGTDGTNTHTQPESLMISTVNNNLAEGWALNDGSGSTAVSTPTGDNLTLTNVTWGSVAGFPGSVAQFNGSSSIATAANDTNTNFDGTTAFSSACWVKPNSIAVTDQYIIADANSGATGAWWGQELAGIGSGAPAGNGSTHVFMSDGTSTIGAWSASSVINTSAPTLVGFTYDGSKTAAGIVQYINGSAISSTAIGTTFAGSLASGSPVVVGSLIPAAGNFGGAVGYCRVASRAYTSTEWTALYAAGPK